MDWDRTVIDWIAGYLPPVEKWHRQILAVLSGKNTFKSLSEQIRLEPKNPEIKIKLGMKYQTRHLRQIALPIFKEAASLDPEGKIMMKLDSGEEVSCREMADYQYARTFMVTDGTIEPEHLEKFVRDYPLGRLAGEAYLYRTRSARLEDKDEATRFLELMAMRPHDPVVLERYVSKMMDSRDEKESNITLDRGLDYAEKTVRALDEYDPTSAALNYARIWFLKDDPSQAEAVFGPEFKSSQLKRWASSLVSYAEFWTLKNRNLQDAEKSAEIALSMCPDDASLRRAVARIYFYLPARPEKAIAIYGPAFKKSLESNAAELYEYFSFWLARKINLESAQDALETLLQLKPESVHYRSSAANAYLKVSQPDRALAVFGPTFIARHAEEVSVLYDYGMFWVQKNTNLESAVPALVKSTRESPRNGTDQWRAATALEKANKSDAVFSVFGPDYLLFIKDDPTALTTYAQFWLDKKTNQKSVMEALDMVSRSPAPDWFNRWEAAYCYLHLGRVDKADEIFGTAYMKTIAGDAMRLQAYAQFWLGMKKNLLSALEAARAACELEKDSSKYWNVLAELFLANGKPREASEAIDKAISLTKSKDLLERFEAVKKKIKTALEKK